MRKIEQIGQFRRDYKREAKGRHGRSLDMMLVPIITALANDETAGTTPPLKPSVLPISVT